jgi:hypothetical protein
MELKTVGLLINLHQTKVNLETLPKLFLSEHKEADSPIEMSEDWHSENSVEV